MTHEALLLHVKSYKDKHLCHYLHYKLNETLFSLSTIFTWKTDYSYSDWVLAYLFFKMNQVSQLLQGMLPVIVYFSSENLNFEKCVCYCQSLIASQYWRHFWWVSGVTNYCGFFFFFFFWILHCETCQLLEGIQSPPKGFRITLCKLEANTTCPVVVQSQRGRATMIWDGC